MAVIRVRCGACSRVLEVHRTAAGSTISCLHCRAKLMVPGREVPAPSPVAPPSPRPPPPRAGAALGLAPAGSARSRRRQSASGAFAILLFAVLLLGGAGAAGVFFFLSEEERFNKPILQQGFEEIVAAVHAGDADRLARHFDVESETHRSRLRTKYRSYFAEARMEITDAKVERIVIKRGVAHLHYSLNNRIRNLKSGNQNLIGKSNAVMQWRLVGDTWLVFEPDLDFILPE